jgi:hypothetical protein
LTIRDSDSPIDDTLLEHSISMVTPAIPPTKLLLTTIIADALGGIVFPTDLC